MDKLRLQHIKKFKNLPPDGPGTDMKKLTVKDLSSHLFWDIDPVNLDVQRYRKLIIQRVLDYGLLSDWRKIYAYYGLQNIVDVVKNLRDIDRKSAAFIAALSKTPKEEFRCYSTIQSKDRLFLF